MKSNKILLLLISILLWCCSPTKKLKEGELLYTGAKVTVNGINQKQNKAMASELEALTRPLPNKSIFGGYPKLAIYNWAGVPKKEKGIRYWMRTKAGEPPVLNTKLDTEYNRLVLQNYLENNGYFKAKTNVDTTQNGKTIQANYTVTPGKVYVIKSVNFPSDTSALSKTIYQTKNQSLLKTGEVYTLDKIKNERVRIDQNLKDLGYYYFSPEYLKVQIDSTLGNHEVDLFIKVKEETPAKARNIYKINQTVIDANYNMGSDSIPIDKRTRFENGALTIIDAQKLFQPSVFERALRFEQGDVFNRTNQNISLSRLVSLGTFKLVKNEFHPSIALPNHLDAFYYVSPLDKKSLSMELLAKSNSANYNGTELNFNWSNRNTFHGAELLTISVFGGYEVQISGQNNGFNVYRLGTEANLIWPRLISPFSFKLSGRYTPRTKATAGFEFQDRRLLYRLQTFKALFGYQWRADEKREHTLNIGEILFARPQNVTDLYQLAILENPSLKNVIAQQLIFGPTYSFTYSNTMQKNKKNRIYYRGVLDISAAVTGLIAGANVKKGDTIKVFGVPVSQFVKLENEFRYFHKINKTSELASRVIIGTALPFGNSSEMPFIKQFFIGGTNSLRAFRARSIGPGSYKDDGVATNGFLADQSGDLKLEMNAEYRKDLFGFVKGAVFLDAGNIWLLNNNTDKPGAKFTKDFYKEIAIGTGVGLRFDLSFLVLRTDFAFPLRKPYLTEGDRWVIDKISLGNSTWRKDNLIFNLAIGYPF